MFNVRPLNRSLVVGFLVTGALLVASPALGSLQDQIAGEKLVKNQPRAGVPQSAPPTKIVEGKERVRTDSFEIDKIVREAKPMAIPEHRDNASKPRQEKPDGPEVKVDGALPLSNPSSITRIVGTAAATAATATNGLWTGSFSTNPNRQVGKLYYDVKPGLGEDWRHCTATAVNSENKSVVITAGHCVFSPDPDQNGLVTGNGFWYEHVQFCPGYEYGCKLGVWHSRQIFTTNSWFYGSGSPRRYDWSDDVAIVLVSPNTSGYLVNAVGGQGISFNNSIRLYRHSFGYPAPDYRFPTYANTYNAQDLIYCPGYDQPDAYGNLVISCTMTGGASGGPWITSPAANWFGYVNSVNSHKPTAAQMGAPHGGELTMGGPYFGAAEADLFQYARAR